MKKKRLFRIILFITCLIIGLELVLRILFCVFHYNSGDDGFGPIVLDKELGYDMNRNFSGRIFRTPIRTGGYGERKGNGVNIQEKEPIYIIGDSQIANFVASDYLFTNTLNKSDEGRYYINLGVPGYSTLQEYLKLKKIGLSSSAKVLLFFYIGNDFVQLLDYPETVPGLIKNGTREYRIVAPNELAFPSIVNYSAIGSILFPVFQNLRYRSRISNEKFQGLLTYEHYLENKEDYKETLDRYRFLMQQIEREFSPTLLMLGNFYLDKDNDSEQSRFFQKMISDIAVINQELGISEYVILFKKRHWDRTLHLNQSGNFYLADETAKIVSEQSSSELVKK